MKIYTDYIKNEIEDFENTEMEYAPVYANTFPALIRLIDLYSVGRFKDGDYDKFGWKKPFYEIINNPIEITAKQVDFDTKNIIVKAEEEQSYYPAWLMRKRLNLWMKENIFSRTLNKFVFNTPKYGSSFLKKANRNVFVVPIQNIIVKPDVERIEESPYLIEKLVFSPATLKKQKNWQNIDEVIAKAEDDKIEIYERIGEVEGSTYNHFIVDKNNTILFKGAVDDIRDIYRMMKWEEIPGRLLGRGVAERLLEAQIQENQLSYYKLKGLRWTSKHIWQTSDQNFTQNLTTDIDDGDVVFVGDLLRPVPMEERNLHVYQYEEARWDRLINKNTFSYEIMAGERLPSGVPLGTAILSTKMAEKFYDFKREEMGIFLKEIVFDWILPEFKKDNKVEHFLSLEEFNKDEIEKIKKLIATNLLNRKIVEYIGKKGLPSPEKIEVVRKVILDTLETQKSIKIPENFYENLKVKIDVVITNEQIDTASKLATLQTILAMLAQNPSFLQNPEAKSVFYDILNTIGLSPVNFSENNVENPEVLVGGSLPKFNSASSPVSLKRKMIL